MCVREEGDVHSDVLLIFIAKSSGQACSGDQKPGSSIARALNNDGGVHQDLKIVHNSAD